MVSDFTLKLIEKKEIAPSVTSFYFSKPDNFEYTAGQYLRLSLRLLKNDDRGDSRYFTIASAPSENYILITTKMQPSEFKRVLYSLNPSDSVQVRGPFGSFVYQDNHRGSHVFIAGGVGITPFRSMLYDRVRNGFTVPVQVLASYRSLDQAIFGTEMEDIEKTYPLFRYTPVFSNESPSDDYLTGMIDEGFIKAHVANFFESVYYITGPTGMVESVQDILIRNNVTSENILIEKFPGYRNE